MKFLSTEEHILKISNLLKTQNKRIKVRFDQIGVAEKEEREKIQLIIKKFELIKNYVSDELMPALYNLRNNQHYTFQYFDDFENKKLYETTFKSNYFKIIIKHAITGMTNFVIVSFNMREFLMKLKIPNSESDVDIIDYVFPIERFSKGKFRTLFFEYLEQIVTFDTFPKLRKKAIEVDKYGQPIPIQKKLEAELEKVIAERKSLEEVKIALPVEEKDTVIEEDKLIEGDTVKEGEDKLVENEDKIVEDEDTVIENEDKLIENEDTIKEGEDKLIENKDTVIEAEDKLVENKDTIIEDKDKLVENEDTIIEDKDKLIETEDKLIEGENKLIEEDTLYNDFTVNIPESQ